MVKHPPYAPVGWLSIPGIFCSLKLKNEALSLVCSKKEEGKRKNFLCRRKIGLRRRRRRRKRIGLGLAEEEKTKVPNLPRI